MSKIKVKFLIDKEQKRLIFAEAGSDFVDVLFSFLTLPLGRIVRLLKKQSGFGSLDSLYESVEQLDAKNFRTEACKEMLLNPTSVAADVCEDLKLKNIHYPNPNNLFICKEKSCLVKCKAYYSHTANSRCSLCGKLMDKVVCYVKELDGEGGVFVNDNINFMITADLWVIPASLMKSCSLLKDMQIKDTGILEERVIEFGTEEALDLLQRSLVSRNALTEICFPDACVPRSAHISLPIEEENAANESEEKILLKLLVNEEGSNVVSAEVGEDFINPLLSFLTLPLGSVLKFLPPAISLGGCINNLYSSAETIDLDCFRSEDCRNMLLTPALPPFYGIENPILEIEEITSEDVIIWDCKDCNFDEKLPRELPCSHENTRFKFVQQNPKLTKELKDAGRNFVAGPAKFMVADNLHVSSLSFISAIGNGMPFPISDLNIKEVCMYKDKVRLLTGVMLNSKTVLNDIFSPESMQQLKTTESKKRRHDDEYA